MTDRTSSCLDQSLEDECLPRCEGKGLPVARIPDQADVMRVAVLVWGLEGGAFANLGTALAYGLQAHGVEVNLVSVRPVSHVARRIRSDLSVTALNAPRASLAILPLARYLRRKRPDILLPMGSINNCLAIVARMVSRVDTFLVVSEHNIMSLELSIDHRRSLKMRVIPALVRILYPVADGIVAPSWDILRDPVFHAAFAWEKKSHAVIPNPLTWGHWRGSNGATDPDQNTPPHPWLGSDRNVPVVLSVGRLVQQKGFDVLLRAIGLLHHRGTRVRLIILGDGPLRAELEAVARELGIANSVALLGFVDNPRRYLQGCDVFVLASRSEGFGLALTEAMSLGKPVIATRAPGGPTEIIRDSDNGLLVPVDDPAALAEAIARVVTDRAFATRLAQAAKERSRAYEPAAVAAQYIEFFRRLQRRKALLRTNR